MRLRHYGLLLGFLLLAACSPQQTARVSTSTPTEQNTATPAMATATHLPPSQTPTRTPLPSTWTPQPEPTQTQTPTETPPTFRMCSPLQMHPLEELTQIIGDPYHPPPPNHAEERHHGVDFSYYHWGERDSMQGEPVQSVLPGVVAAATGENEPYGNMVIIETVPSSLPEDLRALLGFQTGDSLYVLYAHLNKPPLISLGERVDACQQIGEVGMTGRTEIPHLHLETRLGPTGSRFESMRFYDTRATRAEMDAYVLWRTSGVFRHFDPMRLLLAVFP